MVLLQQIRFLVSFIKKAGERGVEVRLQLLCGLGFFWCATLSGISKSETMNQSS